MTVAQGLSLIERHERLLPSQPATLPTFHGAKILVAEDNKINREVISEILKNARCQVILAQNGRQANDLDAGSAMTHLIKQLGHLPALSPLLLKIREQLDLFDFTGTLLLVEQPAETLSCQPEKKIRRADKLKRPGPFWHHLTLS